MKTFPGKITRFGLFLFAFSLPISHVPVQFGIGFALLGWLGDGIFNKRWQVRWHFFFVPLMFYIVWNIIAAAISPRPLHSLGAVLDNEWPLLIMLMMFWTINDVQTLLKLVNTLLVTSSVTMAYAIWQTFGGVELYRNMQLDAMGGYYRAVGFYGFYLTFAALAMSVFFLSVSLFAEEKNKKRWWYAASSLVSFLAVIGSFARSIWLSFAAAIPLFAFSRSRKIGIVSVVFLITITVVGVLTVPTLKDRLASVMDLSKNETRLNLWTSAIAMAKDYPVFGVGEDNWDFFFERYRVQGGYYDTTVHPHNDYFNTLISSGVPGLLAFVSMWVSALVAGFTTAKKATNEQVRAIALGATFSVLGFLVGSFFQNYYATFVNCLGWWFLAGLIFSAHAVSKTDGM
ncbi:MAG: O-antigen ligase family protein [Ignavibacteriales bacterium]|nr:O-antigen ligase family protein [Ignavibacteriales bacterium]